MSVGVTEASLLLLTALSIGAEVTVASARTSSPSGVTRSTCGRVEGHVRRRDGSAVDGKLVLLVPAEASELPTRVAYTDAEGAFRFERVAPGQANAVLFAGGATPYQRTHTQAIEVRPGETVSVDFVLREVRVTGHVTRSGAPAAGLRLALEAHPGHDMSYVPESVRPPRAEAGPDRTATVTREDGSFEMIAEDPGSYTLHVAPLEGPHGVIGCSEVEIPDADSHVLDVALGGATVAGVIVDAGTGQPVADARVGLSRYEGATVGREEAFLETPDGRFALHVQPGRFEVSADAEGYLDRLVDLDVPAGGVADLRLGIARGAVIEGRVMNEDGTPARSVSVTAEGAPGWVRHALTLADGSFRIQELHAGTYDLAARATLTGPAPAVRFAFAFASGVAAGVRGVALRLRPGGRLRLQVRTRAAAPVRRASASLVAVDGAPVPGLALSSAGVETEPGVLEFIAPAGSVTLDVLSVEPLLLRGRTVVEVPSGGDVAASVTLQPVEPQEPSAP